MSRWKFEIGWPPLDLLPKIRAGLYMRIADERVREEGMAKRNYSEVEMIGALKQMEAGRDGSVR